MTNDKSTKKPKQKDDPMKQFRAASGDFQGPLQYNQKLADDNFEYRILKGGNPPKTAPNKTSSGKEKIEG